MRSCKSILPVVLAGCTFFLGAGSDASPEMVANSASGGLVSGGRPPDLAAARRAAADLARFGILQGDPMILLGAIEVLLASGATLDEDDPWQVATLVAQARHLAGEDPSLAGLMTKLKVRSRGALEGPIRNDLTLDPGARIEIEYLAVPGEVMDVEVRLKRGSEGADLDLRAFDDANVQVAVEASPATGILGTGAYIRWVPETCARFTVEIQNAGTRSASFALVAARPIILDCEPGRPTVD